MNKLLKLSIIAAIVFMCANTVDAKMLSIGSSGDEVASLQTYLIANGYPIPLIQNGQAKKGYFGEQTKTAVMMYQETQNVPTTGYIDSNITEQTVGSVTGPELMSPFWTVNGFTKEYRALNMQKATTTLCAMKAPSATSTLQFVSWKVFVGTSTAATIDIGTSTTAYSTSTLLVTATSLAASSQGYAYWMPAGGSANNDVAKMSPNEYVIVKTAGTGSGGYTYSGRCLAEFNVL